MTKREMVYEIAKATNTTSGKLARAGKPVHDLDRIVKNHSTERITEVYEKFLADKEHALFYFNIL